MSKRAARVGKDIGRLLVVQPHGRHWNGGCISVLLTSDRDWAGKAVEQDFDQRIFVSGHPLAALKRRVNSGQTLASGLMAVEAKCLVHGLARMRYERGGRSDLADVFCLGNVAVEGELVGLEGSLPKLRTVCLRA